MPNIHEESNKLIAAHAGKIAIGKSAGDREIFSLVFERISNQVATVRAVCYDAEGQIVDIAEAAEFSALRKHLAESMKIGLRYSELVYQEYQTKWAEVDGIDTYNEAEKAKSPGMIDQFFANGLVYSIVHNPSFKIQMMRAEIRHNPAFYTVYVQAAAIEDPDECLVTTESFDSLFESVQFIRNDIEKSLFQAFMPGVI